MMNLKSFLLFGTLCTVALVFRAQDGALCTDDMVYASMDTTECVPTGRITGSTPDSLETQGFVDLGLPSGTLWKEKNEEGFYSYNQAVDTFGVQLPTKEQWAELKKRCKWKKLKSADGGGYKVTGPNKKSIILPAPGYCSGSTVVWETSRAHYWSSTSEDVWKAWEFMFSTLEPPKIHWDYATEKKSVRLVRK